MSRRDPETRKAELLVKVANFIGWHDLDHMQGGVTAEEAFAALAELSGVPAGNLMNIVRGAPEKAER